MFLVSKTQTSEDIRQLGIEVVDIYTSIFAIPGLFFYEMVSPVGIHEDGIHLIGNINQKSNVSKLKDVGNVVLAVDTNKLYADLPDTIHAASDTITVKDVISKYELAKGIKLDLVSEKTVEQDKQEFLAKLNAGFNLNDFAFYLQVIIAQGLDKGLYFSQLDNELVNPNDHYGNGVNTKKKILRI